MKIITLTGDIGCPSLRNLKEIKNRILTLGWRTFAFDQECDNDRKKYEVVQM
jgi:hypothetical protein